MSKPQLKLAENKSSYERAMDEIDEAWRQYRGPTNRPWIAYDGSTTPLHDSVGKSVEKGTYQVKVASRASLFGRILRRLRG